MKLPKAFWPSNDIMRLKVRNFLPFHTRVLSPDGQYLLHRHNSPIAIEIATWGPVSSFVYSTNTASEDSDRSKSIKAYS